MPLDRAKIKSAMDGQGISPEIIKLNVDAITDDYRNLKDTVKDADVALTDWAARKLEAQNRITLLETAFS